MPTFMPNDVRSRPNGFTLVELMVVLFLIGIAATAVVMTVGGLSGGAASQAERFAARIAALRDQAVVEARPLAFWVRASGYGFEKRDGSGWQPLSAKPFETTDWQPPLAANVQGGRAIRIAFDANGLASAPMDVKLSDGQKSYRVQLDESGSVNVSR